MTTGTSGRAVRAGAAALCGLATALVGGAHSASAASASAASPFASAVLRAALPGGESRVVVHPSTGTDDALPALVVGFAALLIGVATTVALHRRSGGHR